MGDLEIALVDEILGCQRVAVLGLKIFQRLFRHGEIIAAPVGKERAVGRVSEPQIQTKL